MQLPGYLQVFSDENKNKSHIPIIIAAVYMVVNMYLAPAYMKNRPPLKIKPIIIAYNFFQVLINLFLSASFFIGLRAHYNVQCGLMHNGHFPKVWGEYRWIFECIFLVKVLDLFDTFFFVLCKKWRNVSFLHMYHHAAMVLLVHFGVRTSSVGFSLAFGLALNSFVHALVYFYYGLAALGPEVQRRLWWKKYLTMFQMAQFLIVLYVMVNNYSKGCETLGNFGYVLGAYVFSLLLLFIDFYRQTYKPESKEV